MDILGLPAQTTVDVGGTVASKVQFSYDGNPVSNAAGIVGHDNTNFAGGCTLAATNSF